MTTTPAEKTPQTRPRSNAGPPPPVKKRPTPPPAWQKPQLGLVKPAAAETVREVEQTGRGTTTTTSREQNSFDGTTGKQSSTTTEAFAGVQGELKLLSIASRDELKVSMEAAARAGAFGAAEQKKAIQRGKLKASMGAKGSGGAGIEASSKAEAVVDRTGYIPALAATFEAAARAGLWANGQLDASAEIGPLAGSVCAKLDVLLGAEAQLKAEVFADLKRKGVGAAFSASAFAGARVKLDGEAEIKLGPAQLMVGGTLEAAAGAGAEIDTEFSVSIKGVTAKFEASAFAGAKAKASGKAAFKIMGKKIVSAKGEVEVSVGAGASVSGKFEIKNGKLSVSAGLSAALGLGAGGKADADIDFAALADVIVAKVGELSADRPAIDSVSPDYEREALPAGSALATKKQEIGYEAVYEDFVAYANKKIMQGEHGIKKERVQAIIANAAPLLRPHFAYVETDKGIQQAAMEAFAGQLRHVDTQGGYIRAWDPVPEAEAEVFRTQKQKEEKWRSARDALTADFAAYATKKANKGKNGIKRDEVQSIITSHWKSLNEAFEGAEPDQVIDFAARQMKAQYLTKFSVAKGKIGEFEVDAEKTAGTKKAAADDAQAAARAAALATLDGKLTAYRASLVASSKATLDHKKLNGLLKDSVSSIKGQVARDEVNAELATAIQAGLGGLVEGVTVEKGVLKKYSEKSGALDRARQAKDAGDVEARQTAAVAAFGESLVGYRELKTKSGKNGLKKEKVQVRLDQACTKVGDWQRQGGGDRAFEDAARQALGEQLLKKVVVEKGVVTTFTINDAVMTAAKQDRRANGKASLEGGAEDDNARRKMIADAVRPGFASYVGELRAAGEKDPSSAKAVPTSTELQKRIDKAVKPIRADINNEAGDRALELAVTDKFPMIESIQIQGLAIRSLEPVSNFAALAKAKRDTGAAVTRAMADLTAELAPIELKSRHVVQTALDKYRIGFQGLDPDEADVMMTAAVTQAFGPGHTTNPLEELEIEGGRVKKLAFKSPVGSTP
ncbi:hypothetical protein [Nocardioides sp.]|uniref:hypothetical protein n=1 Tax=Nocardioides sp. TaxID=35761 RepID=UPI0035665791